MKLLRLDIRDMTEQDVRLVRERFPERWKRASRLAKREDQFELIAAGALLYYALGADESEIRTDAHGRPFISDGPYFSLSHSGGHCVLALSGMRIGVDTEKLDGSNLIAAEASLTAEELEWIKPEPLERFHLLWTRKESIFKAVGGFDDPKRIPALEGRAPYGFSIGSTIAEGFALSVCSEEKIGSLQPTKITRKTSISIGGKNGTFPALKDGIRNVR